MTLISLLACLWFVPTARAELIEYPQHMIFENIVAGKDVGLGEAEAMLADHEGFMWFAGRNHLIRYDGKSFVKIQTEVFDENGKRSLEPSIQNIALFEDRDNTLWVGTRNGLRRYNRDREVLESLDSALLEVARGRFISFTSIAQAQDGTLYLASYEGLFALNPDGSGAERVRSATSETQKFMFMDMMDILIRDNVAWLGTVAGLMSVDLSTKEVRLFPPAPDNPNSRHLNYIQALEFDRHGNLWAGAAEGVYAFNTSTETFTLYKGDGSPGSLSMGIIRDVYLDRFGMLWIVSDSQGLSLYDERQDQFIRFESIQGDATTLNTNTLRAITEDPLGDLWVSGYPDGINYHNRASATVRIFQHVPGSKRSIVHSSGELLLEDKDEKLWIGTKMGLSVYDPVTGSYSHYTQENGKSPTNGVISGLIDSDGEIWIGTWASGLLRYDPEQDKLVQIPFDENGSKTESITAPRLNDAYVWSIYEDAQKDLWVTTHNGALSKFDKHTGSFTNYLASGPNRVISSPLVWTVLEDSLGRFWIGTAGGLTLLDRETGETKIYQKDKENPGALVNTSILTIHEDHKNRLWFGTDGGLHLYHPESDTFSVFNTTNGFLDNGIRAIVEDKNGYFWLGTNKGVVKFNPDTLEVENFSTFNGQPIGTVDTNVGLISKRGKLIFGTANGVFSYDINSVQKNTAVPAVVLTRLNLFTNQVRVGDDSGLLPKALNNASELVFYHTQNMFSIEFAALNYKESDKNQYAYMLEGFDSEWRHVGNHNQAIYTNLSPGRYTFRVKASNNDGIWNEHGRSIQIHQLPPPWATWWAKTLYILIFLYAMAWFFYSQRQKRFNVEKANVLLEAKVAERTREIKAKKDDIQAMLGSITQGLFTINKDGRVHHEYSIYLESIFETEHIAGRKASELLFDGVRDQANLVAQVDQSIGVILGEDQMNFEFNEHLLISEYRCDINGSEKHLEVDWSPIVVDSIVDKLMVSVRDVTDLNSIKLDSLNKRREIDVISQLIEIPDTKFQQFLESSKRYLENARTHLESGLALDDATRALLFRYLHTIKGNSRTLGFTFLSDVIHNVENMYVKDEQKMLSYQQQEFLQGLERVGVQLSEYETIYQSIVGRHTEVQGRSKSFDGFYRTLKERMTAFLNVHPEYQDNTHLKAISKTADFEFSSSLRSLLLDIENSFPSIAAQLGKEVPSMVVAGDNVRIKYEYQEVMSHVFTHILRNSLDHGLEDAETRLGLGKPAAGTVTVEVSREDGLVNFTLFDDGSGIDLEKLYRLGLTSGKWQEKDRPSIVEVANSVFDSGVSTKQQATDISGRGVGLDAVKKFIEECNGTVELIFDADASTDRKPFAHCPFKVVVSIPADYCLDTEDMPASKVSGF